MTDNNTPRAITPDEVQVGDRPEPETEWITDGICVDKYGDTWALYSGEWYESRGGEICSASELVFTYGPVARHPAVVAAEKRSEQRVLNAVDETLATLTRDLITPEQYEALMQPWRRVIDGWAS